MASKILQKIKNLIFCDNIIYIHIRIHGIVCVNGSPLSPDQYLALPEFKDEVNKKLHAQGSTALSVDYISATCVSMIDIDSQDQANLERVGLCCCCCLCFFIPYAIYQLKYGKLYDCVVRLTVNNDVVSQTTTNPQRDANSMIALLDSPSAVRF